ncbi:lysosomal-trafficking regulator-like [Centruroides sculpturatus]|uniref:lysosomal-trafficking regulator-like n=1 Tax=Centruroides sculpturatus TaxID=218467 RepID=UPI000C6CE832|nr:lysosomal-trafficking regulator-like [Centruroides sculpturatus]
MYLVKIYTNELSKKNFTMDNKYEILRSIWLKFIETPQEYVEERQKLLDEFLMRFIHLRVTEKESNYEDFGDWSMVGSLIVHHFMSDIHQICQSIQKSSEYNMKTDISDDDTEIIDKLHEYLLKGRGWKLLFLLSNIGMQGVTCTKELINLVISLFPVCLQIQAYSLNSNDLKDEEKKIVDLMIISLLEIIMTVLLWILKLTEIPINNENLITVIQEISVFSDDENSSLISDLISCIELRKNEIVCNITNKPLLYSSCIEDLDHHVDILELQPVHKVINKTPPCCVSIMCNLLLNIRTSSKSDEINLKAIEALQKCGLCCCMNFNSILNSLLKMLPDSSQIIQVGIIRLIEKTILKQFDLKDEEKKIVDLMIISLLEIIMTVLLWILKLTEIPINNENLITVIQEISVFSDDENSSLISDLISCIELRKNEIVCNITNKPLLYSSCIEDLDHHVDILELQPVHKVINKTPPCCVSIMCNLLLNIRTSSKSDEINLKAIEALQKCGLCCCMNFNSILNSLLKMLPDSSQIIQFLHYEQEYHLPSESSEEIDIADEGYDADIEIEENLSMNVSSFIFQGILKIIFNNLESILVSSLPECRELQGYIMELFFLVGQYSITEEELQLFFNFFKVSLAPVDTLLNGLNRLIKSLPKAPSEYIIFPTKNISNVSENYDDDSFNLLQVEDHHPLKIRLSLLDNSETELCSWKCATALFPLCDDSIWHPFENGFSVTLWLSIGSPLVSKDYSHEVSEHWKDKGSFISMLSSEETDCQMKRVGTLHVLSIGTELMFETWIDPQCGSLIFRITKCASDGSYYCLAETSCHKLIEPHKWQHITINYKQIKKEETIADIIVIVDGYKVSKFFLHYSNQSEKFQHSYVLFGHNGKKFYSSSYYIGNLMFFQDNVLTREHSYYLSQLGPDIRNITDCHLESQLKFFPQSLVPLMLESDISVEALTCMKIPSLVILQEKLLATYSPKKPNILSTYPNIFNTVVSLLASFTGISPPFKVGTDDQRPSQQQPVDKVIKFNIKNVHTMKSLLHSIETMGGIKSILFLFGRVVECSSEEKSHADALELLFYLLQKDAKIYTTFQEINGMLLVKQVLESEKCITSYLMLQVFLNACISGTILQIDSSNGAAFVDSNSKSVIINPLMFKEMIICWKIWEKIDTEVLKTLFSILQTLVRDKHSYQKYNISQMLSVSTEDVLFSILEDKFSSNENVLLSKEIAVAIPWLIQKFFNTFKLSLLKKIFNCLLLLHQASSTYICHAPSSFYFLFTQNERGLIKSLENTSDDSSYEEINEGIERIDLQKPLDEASNSSQDNLLQSKSNLSKENKDSDYLRINYEILYLGNEMPDNISSESFPNECDLDKNHSNLTKDDTVSEADKIVTREQLQNKNHNVDNINCESVPEVEDEIVLDNSMLSPHSYKFFLSEEEWEIISLYSNDSKDQGFANIFIGDENTESEEESYSQPTLRDDVIFNF